MTGFSDLHIILGSASPRRRELLAGLDIEFEVDTGNTFEEYKDPDVAPERIPVIMAEGKSQGFHRPLKDSELLITADTVVVCGDRLLGKPHNAEEAREMLRTLSGRSHTVITAVVMRSNSRTVRFSENTEVRFAELTERQIDYYLQNYRPYDKAGSYGIQEWIGFVGIESINGSYFNVMGFPVQKVWTELNKF